MNPQTITQSKSPNPTRAESQALSELWHVSRTAVAGNAPDRRSDYDRKLWVAREYNRMRPDCNQTCAYKKLERTLAGANL